MWNETLVEPGLSLFEYFKSAKSIEVNDFRSNKTVSLAAAYWLITVLIA